MKSQITIKKLQDLLIKGVQTIYVDDDSSRRMWWASLEVIQKDFLSHNYKVLNLSKEDGYEPFLMIINPNFQCILSIVGEKDKKILLMKCDEESLKPVSYTHLTLPTR